MGLYLQDGAEDGVCVHVVDGAGHPLDGHHPFVVDNIDDAESANDLKQKNISI
jgi:hypothetical protein